MTENLEKKLAKQFDKDHQEWLKLYRNGESTLDERPKGKEYNLIKSGFQDADLMYANLYNANLFNANLYNANLYNANLQNANLHYADLTNANLMGANLFYVNLNNANLTNADLFSAKIGIKWKEYIKNQNVKYFEKIQWIKNHQDPFPQDITFSNPQIENMKNTMSFDDAHTLIDEMRPYFQLEKCLQDNNFSEEAVREIVAAWIIYKKSQ